jgi:hypothetical protein
VRRGAVRGLPWIPLLDVPVAPASARRTLRRAHLLVVVLSALVRVEVGLRRRTLPVLCASLGIGFGSACVEPGSAPSRAWVAARVRATDRVLRWWPYGDTCLRRCLVAGHLIRITGPRLVLGVRREESGVVAHAWLEVGGRPVDPSAAGYRVLST